MKTSISAALFTASSAFAAEATGFEADGASIDKATGNFFIGWTDESATKLIEKVHNTFTFKDSNKWSGHADEVAEVFATYKDGTNSYTTVVAALSAADTSANTYTLTQTTWTSTGKPTVADDIKPTEALQAASVTKASTLTMSVSGTTNPNGPDQLDLGDEYQIVRPKSWA